MKAATKSKSKSKKRGGGRRRQKGRGRSKRGKKGNRRRQSRFRLASIKSPTTAASANPPPVADGWRVVGRN